MSTRAIVARWHGAAVALAVRLEQRTEYQVSLKRHSGHRRYPDGAVARSKRGSMSVFAILLSSDMPEAGQRIRARYPVPRHFQLSDYLFLVRSDSDADSVARRAGIAGQGRLKDSTGVVFKLGPFYSGFDSRAMWDWLAMENGAAG